jgi:hypothetical protein
MSYSNPRIEATDNQLSIVMKMSNGNPGAVTVLAKAMKLSPSIDPQCAFGPFGPPLSLDTFGIYESHIWVLYKDVCNQDMVLMLALLRAVQLGIMLETELHTAIDKPFEFAAARAQQLLEQVKEELVDFGAAQ